MRLDATLGSMLPPYSAYFRDDDPDRSLLQLHHLWWNSRLPRAVFVSLVDEAATITKARVSLSQVRNRRSRSQCSMPYFFAVLRQLLHAAAAGKEVPRS